VNKITFSGNAKAVEHARALVLALDCGIEELKDKDFIGCSEPESDIRLKLQKLIDEQDITAHIFVNDKPVWSKHKILANLDRIMKHGRLYDKSKPKNYPIGSLLKIPAGGDPILSKYFYDFLHLVT
jgi:hypothetical protein